MDNSRRKTTWIAAALLLGLVACGDDDEATQVGLGPAQAGDAASAGASEDAGSAPLGEAGLVPAAQVPDDKMLPIVFVHGFAGSAQQYESQAMRFQANGYPADRIRAFEHDGMGRDIAGFVAGTDAFIDAVRSEFATEKVYLVGHSRGTFVSTQYLADPARAAKVAKYIALDGAPCPGGSVPCIAPNQMNLPGQAHVEVATSAESFAKQYEFLMGMTPTTTAITPQMGPVTISGRVVNFPANTGRQGTLRIFEVDSATGARVSEQPLQSFEVGESGAFGPVTVSPDKHYELVMSSPTSPADHHFYMQRFLRDSKFVRLLSGPPDTATRMNTNVSDNHAALTVSRQREWMTSDVLEVSTTSASRGNQPAVNVIADHVGNNRIAIHLHDDAATPSVSTLMPLPYFPDQAFQTGVDVYMPAATPPDGTITLRNLPRGDATKPQILTLPNWASSGHVISVMFADYAQD